MPLLNDLYSAASTKGEGARKALGIICALVRPAIKTHVRNLQIDLYCSAAFDQGVVRKVRFEQ